jgi:hypothetical protein
MNLTVPLHCMLDAYDCFLCTLCSAAALYLLRMSDLRYLNMKRTKPYLKLCLYDQSQDGNFCWQVAVVIAVGNHWSQSVPALADPTEDFDYDSLEEILLFKVAVLHQECLSVARHFSASWHRSYQNGGPREDLGAGSSRHAG